MQSRARRHGIRGIYSNAGIVESVIYRIYRVLPGSNPTLSANMSFCVFNHLAGDVGFYLGENAGLVPRCRYRVVYCVFRRIL